MLILIPPEQRERVSQLFAKVSANLEIYTTVEEFITECYDTQYSVAILPIGVISAEQRVLLTSALGSMRPCPSIIVYSPQGGSLGWPGIVDSGDIVFVPKPFSEDRLRDAIGLAAADFEERSQKRQKAHMTDSLTSKLPRVAFEYGGPGAHLAPVFLHRPSQCPGDGLPSGGENEIVEVDSDSEPIVGVK
jgi:FixJ family two-component response regulator